MIINPYRFSRAAPSPWHAASAHSAIIIDGMTIRQTNRSSGLYSSARLDTAYSGKCYHSFSVTYGATGSILGVGAVNGTQSLTSDAYWMGANNASGAAWGPTDSSYANGTSVGPGFNESGSIPFTVDYDIAVDTATRRVWIRKSGGSWIGGGNPAAGTTPTFTAPSATSGLFFAGTFTAFGDHGLTYAITALLGADAVGAPPSGYSVWSGG